MRRRTASVPTSVDLVDVLASGFRHFIDVSYFHRGARAGPVAAGFTFLVVPSRSRISDTFPRDRFDSQRTQLVGGAHFSLRVRRCRDLDVELQINVGLQATCRMRISREWLNDHVGDGRMDCAIRIRRRKKSADSTN